MPGERTTALVRVAIFAVLIAALSKTVVDPDLWGHLVAGRDTVAAGWPPGRDAYSFTSDRPWVNHSWLGDVLLWAAWAVGGGAGLALFKLALVLAIVLVVRREIVRSGAGPLQTALLLALLALGIYAHAQTARPQLYSLLLFAGLLAVVSRADEPQERALALAPAIMVAWGNLHGGWVVGLLALLLWLGAHVVDRRHAPHARLRSCALVGLAVMAPQVNPFGLAVLQEVFASTSVGSMDVAEWQPVTSGTVMQAAPWLAVAAVVALGLWRSPVRPRGWQLLLVVALAVASFRMQRLVGFFAIAAIMSLAPVLVVLGRRRAAPAAAPSRATVAVVAAMAVVFTAVSVAATVMNLRCVRMDYAWGPDTTAAAFVKANRLGGRMLTWYDWGTYAIWQFSPELRVSVDSRGTTVYSRAVLAGHNELYRDGPGAREFLGRLDPDYVWLPKRLPIVSTLRPPEWTTLFDGPTSVVLARREASALRTPAPADAPACFPGAPSV